MSLIHRFGWFTGALGIITLLVEVGTLPVLQFAPTNQSVLVEPFQVVCAETKVALSISVSSIVFLIGSVVIIKSNLERSGKE